MTDSRGVNIPIRTDVRLSTSSDSPVGSLTTSAGARHHTPGLPETRLEARETRVQIVAPNASWALGKFPAPLQTSASTAPKWIAPLLRTIAAQVKQSHARKAHRTLKGTRNSMCVPSPPQGRGEADPGGMGVQFTSPAPVSPPRQEHVSVPSREVPYCTTEEGGGTEAVLPNKGLGVTAA